MAYNIPEDVTVGDPNHTPHHVALAEAVNDLDARADDVEGRATALEGRATSLEGRTTALENAAPVVGLVQVIHGDDPAVARPDAPAVYWRGSVEPNNWEPESDFWFEVGSAEFVGPFDEFAVPFRALSLRRTLSAYDGPAVRVRVGAEQEDIGFTPEGDLDVDALNAFADGADAFVVTWYDQSGSARHITQETDAAQPKITTVNGKPAILFDGVDDLLHGAPGLYAAGSASLALVMQSNANDRANATFVAESSSHTNSGNWRVFRGSNANWNVQATDNAGQPLWAQTATGSNLFDLAQHQGFYVEADAAIDTWRDGVPAHQALEANRSGVLEPERFVIGAHWGTTVSNPYFGSAQELVAWASDQGSSRTAISAIQKAYWGTP